MVMEHNFELKSMTYQLSFNIEGKIKTFSGEEESIFSIQKQFQFQSMREMQFCELVNNVIT